MYLAEWGSGEWVATQTRLHGGTYPTFRGHPKRLSEHRRQLSDGLPLVLRVSSELGRYAAERLGPGVARRQSKDCRIRDSLAVHTERGEEWRKTRCRLERRTMIAIWRFVRLLTQSATFRIRRSRGFLGSMGFSLCPRLRLEGSSRSRLCPWWAWNPDGDELAFSIRPHRLRNAVDQETRPPRGSGKRSPIGAWVPNDSVAISRSLAVVGLPLPVSRARPTDTPWTGVGRRDSCPPMDVSTDDEGLRRCPTYPAVWDGL